jgi:hypothetical protein
MQYSGAPRKISPYGVMTGVRVRSEVDRSILGLSSRLPDVATGFSGVGLIGSTHATQRVARRFTRPRPSSFEDIRKAIAQHWHDNFRDKGVTAREVIDEAERRFEGGFNNGKLMHQDFYAALAEVALDGKTLSSNKLGGWLRAISGKIVGGLYDRNCETDQKLANRRFEKIEKSRTGVVVWALRQFANSANPTKTTNGFFEYGESAGDAGDAGAPPTNAGEVAENEFDTSYRTTWKAPATPATPADPAGERSGSFADLDDF